MSKTDVMSKTNNRLMADEINLSYGDKNIVKDMSLSIPDGKVTIIIGPNACGKSTLLRSLARLLKPKSGIVTLDGKQIDKIATKKVAQHLGLLPQSPIAPQGILVADLVARGRTPHQSAFQQWSEADEAAVLDAMQATQTLELADRRIEELSGGQQQRVWIAMALAQQTEILLLDEPITYLDLPHQIEVLNLVRSLNRKQGRTVVVVLHDINLACRYADHIVALRAGEIMEQGAPADVINTQSMKKVFNLDCEVIKDHLSGTPLIIPIVDE